MEVVLAVITFATAVKDMVELAEKIHASFEKVSGNLRNARALASDIKQTITELKEFCEQHRATVESDQELRKALSNVISKLKQFDSETIPLITTSSPRQQVLSRVKGGFKAWRNGGRIKASIQKLKEEVKQCQMNFVMMSVARIQVTLNELQGATSEGLRVTKQVSDVLVAHNAVSFALQPSSSFGQRLIAASNSNIVAFAQTSSSTSTPIWKTPSVMKGQIIWDAYLKEQIDFIANSLSDISTLRKTYSIEPLEEYKNPFIVGYPLWLTHSNAESLHRGVVMQALKMSKTLENLPMNASIQRGAWDLISLAVGLHNVGMGEEAVKMGEWAVSLFRILVDAHEAIYSPYLVQSLQNLSHYNKNAGNNNDSIDAIKEAVSISAGLQIPTAPVETRVQHGKVLLVYAYMMSTINEDHKRAIELAEQSVKLLEDIIGIDFLSPWHKKADDIASANCFSTQLYQFVPYKVAIVEYARALQVLSNCLIADGRIREAFNAKMRALPIFYDMPSLLAKSTDIELADILYELVSQECKSLLPAERVLDYAEDCIRIYRRHAELNPSKYGRLLCNVLWEKANALKALSRNSDALEVWKEIANIAQQMLQDQVYYANALSQVSWSFRRLKRYEEAMFVRTQSVLTYEAANNMVTASQANGYYELSIDCQLARRFPEAVEAARKAVSKYLQLDYVEPRQWTRQIGQALAELADALFSAGDHEAALNEGHRSMQTFASHIRTNPGCVKSYLYSLRVNIRLAMTVNDERRAIECMDDVLQHMRWLAIVFPKEASLALLQAELAYGDNLERLDHIQEARKYLQELIAKWGVEDHPNVDKDAFTDLHISALISYADILDTQGYTDLALEPIRKGTDIGRPLSATSPVLAGRTVGAMCNHAHLLMKLGRYHEALVVAEGTLKFNRHIKMDDAQHLVHTLEVVGLAAKHIHAYDRVVEVSQEAVNICKSTDFVGYCHSHSCPLCLLLGPLQQLSSGHTNSGNLELGLQYGQEAVDNAKALRAKPCVPSAHVEEHYMEAVGQLGAMYLANDKVDEAGRLFEETRAHYTEKVKKRIGESANFISILHRVGIIYCSEGRHDEGHVAAQEAKTYLVHLAEVFPGLYDLVHIYMRHELTIPSLQVLNRMKEKLLCDHQADLSF